MRNEFPPSEGRGEVVGIGYGVSAIAIIEMRLQAVGVELDVVVAQARGHLFDPHKK